jgi:hypothetical protein
MPERSASRPPSAPARRPRRLKRDLLALAAIVTTAAGVGTYLLDARFAEFRRGQSVGHSPVDSFVGRAAPDFTLPELRSGEPIRLSDSWGERPLVLLFGSFSCPRLFGELGEVRRLYEEFGEQVDFRLVYVREAYHDNPEFAKYLRDHPGAEECGRVLVGADFYGLDFPCVLADSRVEREYDPYPARMLVFDREGEVVFDSQSARNPAGLRLEEGIDRLRDCLEPAAE